MTRRKIVLRFDAANVDEPIIYRLARDYDLVFNILKANVSSQMEGSLVMELTGERYQEGLAYLKEQGVDVQPLNQEVVQNQERCTSCGACTAICPTGALHLARPAMQVEFDRDECVLCQLCVAACPVKAMEVHF
ncbi:MAG TPA: NIL domain-containing protein [Spirochaetia bacterium]|nr:NIL domain-containing protein [Spirochaetia bacterium]